MDFETIMKKQIEQIANDEIEKMIREKVNQFSIELLSKKDNYIAQLMKNLINILKKKQISKHLI